MTRDEWAQLAYLTFGEWWGQPLSEEREAVWFRELERFAAGDIEHALRGLLATSSTWAPKLGELLTALEPPAPAWELAWSQIRRALVRHLPDETAVLAELEQTAGSDVAGWVAAFGPQRLGHEEVEGEHGGAAMHRLATSYREATATPDRRERLQLELVRSRQALPQRSGLRRLAVLP